MLIEKTSSAYLSHDPERRVPNFPAIKEQTAPV